MLLIVKTKLCGCGRYFKTIVPGGRGGAGQIVGCQTCNKVYRRDPAGIVHLSDGERYTLLTGRKFSDYERANN